MARLDTVFIAPFVEVAADRDAARLRKQEQLARVPELKADCEKYGLVANFARLARSYARAADAAFLQEKYDDAAKYSAEAKRIFDEWNKSGATFLNELRLIRSRAQIGDADEALLWFETILGKESRERELYLDWIDVGYIECLVALHRYDDALQRYDEFFARWSKRPNLDVSPYVEARKLLEQLV